MCLRPFGSLAACSLLLACTLIATFLPAADPTAPDGILGSLQGHKEAVYTISYTADGKFLLTGSGDQSIKVWEAATGKELKSFAGPNGHKGLVLSSALSPDGNQFATGGADNVARVWDFPSSRHLREFPLAAESRAVAVTPDGTRVAGGGTDGKIRIWNTSDGKQLHELSGHAGAVNGLAFHPNGQTFASIGADSTLRYWNTSDGKALASFAAHPGAVRSLVWAPGGNAVYTSGPDGTVRFWTQPPVGTRTPQAPFKAPLTGMTLSPDGSQIVAASGQTVRLVATNTGQTTREFVGATGAIHTAAVNNGASLVAAGTADRKVLLWQGKDGQLLMQQPAHASEVTGVAFNGGGNQLATIGKDGMVRIFTVPPAPSRIVPHPDVVRAAVLSSDGKRLATGGNDRMIRLYRLDNLKTVERQLSGHPTPVSALAFAPDGKRLASAGDDEVIRVWDLTKGEQQAVVGAHAGAVTGLTWTGDRLVSTSVDGSVKVWQAPAGSQGKVAYAHAGTVTSLALSPDGKRLVTGCDDRQVRAWSLANGQLERTWTGPTLGVLCVAFSPRGDRIAAGSADRSFFVWEAGSNKEVRKMTGLPGSVHTLALTADGNQALAGLGDGSVRLYDLTMGKEVKSLDGHKGAVDALLLTPQGDRLLSGGADGQVLVRSLMGGPPLATWKQGGAVLSLALSRDGTRVAVGTADKQVRVITIATGKVESSFTTPAEARGLAFSPDGKKLAVTSPDQRARLYTSEGILEEHLAHDGPVQAAVFAVDGRRLYTASADKTARVWVPALIWQGRHEGAVRQAIVSSRGDRIYSGGDDGLVKWWSYGDGKPMGSLRAHTGAVLGVSLSGDAGKLTSAGADRAAKLWDVAKAPTGKTAGKDLDVPITTMALPAAPTSVSLAPSGLRLAVGVEVAGKEQVRIFDTGTGKELLALGESDPIPSRTLAYQPDNRTLLAAGADRTVRLVDVNIVTALEAHPGGGVGLAFHDNGTQLLTAGADKTVKVWNLGQGKLERTLGPLPGAIDSFALARGSSHLATTVGKSLSVWNVATGKEESSVEMPGPARSVAFNSDRTRLSTAHADGRARVWEVVSKREQQGFLHTGPVTAVAFHPFTPTQVVSAGTDGVLGIHTLSISRLVVVGTDVESLGMSPTLGQVLAGGADGKVRLVNASNGNIDRVLEVGGRPITCVSVSRSGQLIATGSDDRLVRLFNYNDGKLLSQFTVPTPPRSLAFVPTSQALVAACADGTLIGWDVVFQPGQPLPPEFGKVLQSFAQGKQATEVAFPTTGSVFYTAGGDPLVRAWKLASETPSRQFNHPATVNSLGYTRDGTLLVTGAGDGKVRVFDVTKGSQVREINAHPLQNNDGAIYSISLDPEGKQVATGSKDGSAKLFGLADGKPIREFKAFKEKEFPKGHQDSVLCVALSPDGKRLATGSADRTIKIWNVADGSVLRELANPAFKPEAPGLPQPAHPGWIYTLRWAEGGKKLVSAGGAPRLKGYVATWDAETGKHLWGKEFDVGTIFSLTVAPGDQTLAIGTGGSLRSERDLNRVLLLKMPR